MTKKTEPKVLATLKRAIVDERREARVRLVRYKALTKKMKNYQQGIGPAPTLDEFEQWRKDVNDYVAINMLQRGVSLSI